LWNNVFRRDEIDVVNVPHLLELHEPFAKLLGREIEAVPLMSNLVILAKDAPEIT
jgi:hypothetical protein